jgi:immunomodulating metalloprotease
LLYLHQRQFEALTQSNWAANREKLGYGNYANKPAPTGEDNLLIALSWITGRDQRPTFGLWGIEYSSEANNQVAAFGFPAESEFFYASNKIRDQSDVRRVDMSVETPVWPFP